MFGEVPPLFSRVAEAVSQGENSDQDAHPDSNEVIEEPLRQIVFNSGGEPSVVVNKVIDGKVMMVSMPLQMSMGFSVMGVVDPQK